MALILSASYINYSSTSILNLRFRSNRNLTNGQEIWNSTDPPRGLLLRCAGLYEQVPGIQGEIKWFWKSTFIFGAIVTLFSSVGADSSSFDSFGNLAHYDLYGF